MNSEIEIAGIKVPKSDWEATPESIKAVVIVLSERLEQIEEQLKKNSRNSSKPPSSDGFGKVERKQKQKSQKNQKQKSSRKVRKLYPIEACQEVYSHLPEKCRHCGEELSGKDAEPHRHQIIEIPKVRAYVIEHQQHQLECACCGRKTRAELPKEISQRSYGERLTAAVGWLSGEHRQSHRMLKSLMKTLFGIEISRGSINRLRQEVSKAIAEPVKQAQEYIQKQKVVNSDETSFSQGNQDGLNPQKIKGWLWVLGTYLVKVFSVELSRGQKTAKKLLGEEFSGIAISDRYSGYNWLDNQQRQVCWAHLKRDLIAIAERSGVSAQIGQALLSREQRLFRWWHRVRDGTMSRQQLVSAVTSLRAGFKAELEEAAALPIGFREKSPLAKTVRTIRRLLKIEDALWTFVFVDGVEPTNNLAEQALRCAVIWRRTSYGSQSQAGSDFVSRILTVVESLKAQQRNPLDYLTEACYAKRLGLPAPSLLPSEP